MTDRSRSALAALTAAAIAFASIAGVGVLLGFPAGGASVAGAIAAGAVALLMVGASRRAASFAPTPDPGPGTATRSTDG